MATYDGLTFRHRLFTRSKGIMLFNIWVKIAGTWLKAKLSII